MNKKDLIELLGRYENMLSVGQNLYFDADEYESIAEYYEYSDELNKAIEVIETGLKIHPNNELLLLKKARYLIYSAHYIDAFEYINNHFNSYDYDLFLLKIECCLHLGLYAEAYELSEKILEDNEIEMEISLSELGFIYLESNYIDEGILYLEKSLEYNPNNKDVLSDLAYAYESKNDLEKVISLTNMLLDLEPYNSDHWLLLGKVYTQSNNYEKAIDAFDFVATIEGEEVSFLKLKAHCLVQVDRIEEAITLLLECIESTPFDEYLYISLIDCYLHIERYNDVIDLVSKYEKELDEDNPVLSAKKAYAHSMTEDMTQALITISKAIEIDHTIYEVNTIAIDIYIKLNMYASALQACQRILTEKNDDIDILEKAVSLSVQIENLDLAIAYQKQIISLDNSSEKMHKLALLYLEISNNSEFNKCINSFDDETLESFFFLFYEKEIFSKTLLTADFMKSYLQEAYNCRLLYKTIKY